MFLVCVYHHFSYLNSSLQLIEVCAEQQTWTALKQNTVFNKLVFIRTEGYAALCYLTSGCLFDFMTANVPEGKINHFNSLKYYFKYFFYDKLVNPLELFPSEIKI